MRISDLKQDYFFDVEQRDIKEIIPQYTFPQSSTHVIYAPDINKILNICSAEYEVVSNQELVQPVYRMLTRLYGEENLDIEASQVDDRKFYFKLKVNSKQLQVQKGDLLNPCVLIENSYDGSLAHAFKVGFHRLVCLNGLMAFEEATSFRKKHLAQQARFKEEYGTTRTLRYIERSLEQLEEKLYAMDQKLKRFQKLTERRLTSKEIRELITAVSPEDGKDKIKFPKKLLVEVPLRLQEETERLDVEPSKWLLYNAFNFQLNHARTALPQEERARMDREILQLIEAW